MTIRFLHTADLHIGKSRTLPDYLERQELMLDGIYKTAGDNDIDVVLMAGDIFESKNIRWNEQQMFLEKLFKYDALGFTTVVCNGNHDELASGHSPLWLPAMIATNGGLKNTHVLKRHVKKRLQDLGCKFGEAETRKNDGRIPGVNCAYPRIPPSGLLSS